MIDTKIKQTFGVNPSNLTDEQWYQYYADYKFIKKQEYENLENVIKNAFSDVLNRLLGNE